MARGSTPKLGWTVTFRDVGGKTRDAVVVGQGTAAQNEKQTITQTGGTTGTFTLTFSGQTTAGIAWNAAASAVQSALAALSNIGTGNVVCTGGPLDTTPVVIEFTGALANTNVAQMTVDNSGQDGTAAVATTQGGVKANLLNLRIPHAGASGAVQNTTDTGKSTARTQTGVWVW